jgi:uncharacterized protein YxjI
MQKKWLSLGDRFRIQDERGQEVFRVEGRAFSWGHKLSLQDAQGRELAFVRQQLLTWGPTFAIEAGGQVVAVVKKQGFSLFRHRFLVDVPGPDDLEARGDFLGHEYGIERHGEPVATISKRWFTWVDTYGIEVRPGENDVLVLATAVVIDLVCHRSGD